MGGAVKELDDTLVRDLSEVAVPLPDCVELRRGLEADDLIGFHFERFDDVDRGDGHRQHDPSCPSGPYHSQGRSGRAAGGDAIVHDDHRATGDRHGRLIAAESPRTRLHLRPLAGFDLAQFFVPHAGHVHDIPVDHTGTVFSDGSHPQLGLERDTQLAHHDDVERRFQRPRHLEGHRHASPGKAQDDRVLVSQRRQRLGELSSGVLTVTEQSHRSTSEGSRMTRAMVAAVFFLE